MKNALDGKQQASMDKKCPFVSSSGYSTFQTRDEYVRFMKGQNLPNRSRSSSSNSNLSSIGSTTCSSTNQLSKGCVGTTANNDNDNPDRSMENGYFPRSNDESSLQADMDISKPLYFWQLYSLLGQQPVVDICRDFYDFVYADIEAPWFRMVFEQLAPKHHHILAQAGYWIDAMGGGCMYMGGLTRLNFHHQMNASEIMNARGAQRWMFHMKQSLKKNYHHFQSDPRILPCIIDFLETKMKSYAERHGWEFDSSDFELEGFLPKEKMKLLTNGRTLMNRHQNSLGTVHEDEDDM